MVVVVVVTLLSPPSPSPYPPTHHHHTHHHNHNLTLPLLVTLPVPHTSRHSHTHPPTTSTTNHPTHVHTHHHPTLPPGTHRVHHLIQAQPQRHRPTLVPPCGRGQRTQQLPSRWHCAPQLAWLGSPGRMRRETRGALLVFQLQAAPLSRQRRCARAATCCHAPAALLPGPCGSFQLYKKPRLRGAGLGRS